MSALEQLEVRPVRNILRDYISQVIAEGGSDVTYEELIAGAQAELGNDEEFVLAAARDIVPALMPELFREAVHRRKRIAERAQSLISKNRGIRLTVHERLNLVYESTGMGGYKKLLSCSKIDLITSNERDRTQISSMQRWVGLRDDFISLLPNDEDLLGETVPEEVLDDVWLRHFPETD